MIRTCDIQLPKLALYQAELRPDTQEENDMKSPIVSTASYIDDAEKRRYSKLRMRYLADGVGFEPTDRFARPLVFETSALNRPRPPVLDLGARGGSRTHTLLSVRSWAGCVYHFATRALSWCRQRESNPRSAVYKTAALPLGYAGDVGLSYP